MSFKDFIRYIRIYKRYIGRRLYIVFVLTITSSLAEGFGITLLLPLLRTTEQTDSAEDPGFAERILNDLLGWMGIQDSMMWILVFIGVVFLMKGLLKFAAMGYQGILQANLLRDLKSRLYKLYSNIDYQQYLEKNTGHFINVITQQVNDFFQSFKDFNGFINQAVMTATYFLIAFAITWKFAAMAVVVGVIVMLLFRFLNNYVRNLSRQVSAERSELNKLLVQGLQSLKYILSTGQSEKMNRGVNLSVNRLTHHIRLQRIAGALTSALKEPITILFIVGIIAIHVGVMNQPLAPIFVSILLFNRGMQSLMSIQSQLQSTMDRIGAVEMVAQEFDMIRQNQEISGDKKIDKLNIDIEYKNVSFWYGEEQESALKNISLVIPARSTVAFVGESGAGKSTFVDTLNLLLKPQQGNILVDGMDSWDIDVLSWRNQLGYVSQETVIFDDTIANNISLWSGEYDSDETFRNNIHEAAQKAYADEFIQELPNRYQTRVGDRGVRLSGGQKQRLFIARELFKQPNLLILDEATSALDTESERYIQRSIDDLRGEMTVVIIAHRLSTIKNVDRVFVMVDGQIEESGTYDELVKLKESRFRNMVNMQSL